MSIRNEDMLVKDVMLPLGNFPVISEKVIFKEALEEMGKSRLGIVCIVDAGGGLLGIVTDGDVRRKLLKVQKPFSAFYVDDALTHGIIGPITVNTGESLVNAVKLMEDRQIWDLPVLDDNGKLKGLLHLHNAIRKLLDI
jgi:CBS domain-containing protein